MRESIRFKDQKDDDDDADGHLAQEGDVVLQSQELIDRTVAQRDAEPFHQFRQQHHEGGSHQRAHDRAKSADDDHREEDDRAINAEHVGDHLIVRASARRRSRAKNAARPNDSVRYLVRLMPMISADR